MITRTFKLCLNAGTGSAPYINVSQYDEGETWLFELYSETGERYIPSTGAIVGVKSDGHGIVNTGTVDSEGRVVITETQQMTASAGRAIFELSIDGLTHGTANFIVAVERKPTDDAVMSDSDLSLIQEAIDSAEVIVEVIGDGDPSEVIGEHVDAWLDAHPEATTTVLDGAITAPKINSTLWDKLLVSEEASGAVASFDDGADDVPVSSLKVNLEPIQTGTGDPSPSNVRPIIAANGKNLLQITATSQTQNGLTFTVNADGTITVNGTATANTFFYFLGTAQQQWQTNGKALTFTGCPSGGSNVTYRVIGRIDGDAWIIDTGSGANIPNTATYISNFGIGIQSGIVCNNLVFKPMICLSSITDSTYQPYQSIMVMAVASDKNLFDKENATLGYRLGTDGYTFADSAFYSSPHIEVTVGTTYYKNSPSTGAYHRFFTYNANKVPVRKVDDSNSITIESGEAYVRFCGYISEIDTACLSTTDIVQTYYPYTLGQNVYGGTVDLATGVLTVTKKFVTSSNFVKETSYDVGNSSLFSATGINDANINPTLNRGSISDKLKYDTAILSVERAGFYVGYGHIYARIAGISTLSDFNTAIGGSLSVAYTLATPQTIQLTPTEVKTLLGYNNISSSGTVEVIYHADTKLYVDKMTNVDNAIIAPTEADFVATRNYTVNDLVIVNDTLYKVTANIATGSAITPNSNVTTTTLSALIKALS